MVGGRQTAIRFTDQDEALLAALQAKLGLNVTDVVRLAIRRMADMEGIRGESAHAFTDRELLALRSMAATEEALSAGLEALAGQGLTGADALQTMAEAVQKLQGQMRSTRENARYQPMVHLGRVEGIPVTDPAQLRALNEVMKNVSPRRGPKQRNHMQDTIDRVTGANKRRESKK
jgi:hypothetical protein